MLDLVLIHYVHRKDHGVLCQDEWGPWSKCKIISMIRMIIRIWLPDGSRWPAFFPTSSVGQTPGFLGILCLQLGLRWVSLLIVLHVPPEYLTVCKTFNIKSEGFPSTHFCCSIFFVNNFGVASVLILSYLTCLLWWASLKAVVLMDWTHHNHDQTHQHHSHCFDQHRHQKLTRYRLGGKVGALSHWGRSNFCGCGNNFIFHSIFFFRKN